MAAGFVVTTMVVTHLLGPGENQSKLRPSNVVLNHKNARIPSQSNTSLSQFSLFIRR